MTDQTYDIEVHNLNGSESVGISVRAADRIEALDKAAAPVETNWEVSVWDPTISEFLTYAVRATSVQHALTVAAAALKARKV